MIHAGLVACKMNIYS